MAQERWCPGSDRKESAIRPLGGGVDEKINSKPDNTRNNIE